MYDVFQLFDYSDPSVTSGDRATTTVAPQALFMMNSDLVARRRREPGRAICSLATALDDAGRIGRLYRAGLRPPADRAETAGPLAFSNGSRGRLRAEEESERRGDASAPGRRSARSILASNEFIYVR